MSSRNSKLLSENFVSVKEEIEPIYNQPVIVQNAVFDFDQAQTIKAEPEENFTMEINQSLQAGMDGNEELMEEMDNHCLLQISSVVEGYNENEALDRRKKVGRSKKKIEDETPKKITRKNVKKQGNLGDENSVKIEEIHESFGIKEEPVDYLENVVVISDKYSTVSAKEAKIIGKDAKFNAKEAKINTKEAKFDKKVAKVGIKYTKFDAKIAKANAKAAKPTTKVQKTSKTNKKSGKTLKITNYFESSNLNEEKLKIPIQKSQTLPQKSSKNPRKPPEARKSEAKPQNLQSSFVVDDKNATQIKLKISKPSKSLENDKKLNNNHLKITSNFVKQESYDDPIIKPEPQIPLSFPIPDDSSFQFVQYEPKAPKKRREIRLECDHCGKVCKSKYSIIWHMKEHMLTMPFNCNACGKGFSYERSFRQHELTHAAKVKCEICGKSLKPHAMYYHMKYRHTNEKTHKCPMCPKAFKTKDNIARHMMRHNMEFACDICGRKFPENSRLQMHLHMHNNPQDFFCNICNKSFEHIDRHMKRLHAMKRERNLKCRYCEYASDSRQTLKRHEEMHEKRNEILQSKTRKRKIKQKIIEMKTFECKVCNVVLQTKSGYKSHLRHYHKDSNQGKVEFINEVKDESSMESENYVEIKVEQEEVRVIQ